MTADLAAPPQTLTCPACGNTMTPLTTKGTPRKFCSQACPGKIHGGQRKIRDLYADEAEHLLSFGTPIPAVCKALHATPGTLARALYREHRPDLANQFERYAYHQRRTERAA